MSLINYYPKNLKANGWGWHRSAHTAAAVNGFLKGERGGEGVSGSKEPLIGTGSLYPQLPTEEDSVFNAGYRLYPALPAEEYESGAVEEVVEEACASVNVNAVTEPEGESSPNCKEPFLGTRSLYQQLPIKDPSVFKSVYRLDPILPAEGDYEFVNSVVSAFIFG